MSPSAAVGSDAKDHSMQTGLLQRARFFLGGQRRDLHIRLRAAFDLKDYLGPFSSN